MARKLIVLVMALALIAAACGGGEETADSTTTTAAPTTTTTAAPTTTTAAPTTTTAAPTTTTAAEDIDTLAALISTESLEATSGRFEGVFAFETDESEGMPPEFSMVFTGEWDDETESSHVMIDFGGIFTALGEELPPGFEDFFSEPMEMIQVGTTAYLKWGLFSFFTGPDVEWVELTDQDASSFISDFAFGFEPGGTPIDSLEELEDDGAEVELVDTATVRGVETNHYRVSFDVEALTEGMSEQEAEELRETFGSGDLESFVLDVFIDDQGLLYRYSFEFDAEGIPDADGIESLNVTFDIYDYGADIVIEAPEDATPGDQLAGLFGGFLGTP